MTAVANSAPHPASASPATMPQNQREHGGRSTCTFWTGLATWPSRPGARRIAPDLLGACALFPLRLHCASPWRAQPRYLKTNANMSADRRALFGPASQRGRVDQERGGSHQTSSWACALFPLTTLSVNISTPCYDARVRLPDSDIRPRTSDSPQACHWKGGNHAGFPQMTRADANRTASLPRPRDDGTESMRDP